MRLFSLILSVHLARLSRVRQLYDYDRGQNNTLVTSMSSSNRVFGRNKVRVNKMVNKYKNRGFDMCYFCTGSGYVDCPKCENNAYCAECDYTGFTYCHICDGSGKGGPRYRLISIPKIDNSENKQLY